MPHTRYTSDEIVRRGQALYEQQIRPKVEPQSRGKFLVLDVDTGEYEVDSDKLAAFERAAGKHPDPALYILRIGYPSAVKLGSGLRTERS